MDTMFNLSELLAQGMGKIALADLGILVLYLAFCLWVGVKKAGSVNNIREFALGDGQISTTVLVTTIYATYLGAGASIGTIQAIGSMGLLFALAVLARPFKWLVWEQIIANNIDQFRGCLSLNEIMFRLYGKAGRTVTNVAWIMGAIASIAAQTTAAGFLLNYFLGISMEWAVIISIGTLICYTALGGVKSVAMTDTLQFSIFFIMVPLLCFFMVRELGGWSAVFEAVPAGKWSLDFDASNASLFTIFLIYMLLDGIHDNTSMQRYLMARNVKQLKEAFKIVAMVDLIISMMIILLGFVMAAGPFIIDTQEGLWEAIHIKLPSFAIGVVIVGMLAVIMSTADSYLNTASVTVAHDIIKARYKNLTNKQEVLIARIATLFIGTLSASLAAQWRRNFKANLDCYHFLQPSDFNPPGCWLFILPYQ